MHDKDSGRPKRLRGSDAVDTLRRWFSSPGHRPLALVSGAGGADRQAVVGTFLGLLDHMNTQAGEVRRTWVRIAADGNMSSSGQDAGKVFGDLLDRISSSASGAVPAEPDAVIAVDDFDALPRALMRQVDKALLSPGLPGAGVRIVACTDDGEQAAAGLDEPFLDLPLRAIHRRTELLEQIERWALDPVDDEFMLITGPPGAGKSVLLEQAVGHLAVQRGVRVPYALLMGTPRLRRRFDITQLADGVGRVVDEFRARDRAARPPERAAGPETAPGAVSNTLVGDNDGVVVMAGSVHGDVITSGGGEATVGTLRRRLERWAEAGPRRPVMVVVVDALNELEALPGSGVDQLRELLAFRSRFTHWQIKVLLSSHYRPTGLPARVVDLSSVSDADITQFALDRIGAGHGVGALPEAERIARLSHGLFFVADDLVDRFQEEGRLPDRPSETTSTSAAEHVTATLEELDATLGGDRRSDWSDALRVLTLASLGPYGFTAEEMAMLWDAPDAHGRTPETRWPWGTDLVRRVESGPLRRYLVVPELPGERFRVHHPAVREGVLALRSSGPGLGVVDELERFLRVLTPLDGADLPWDAERRRLAVAMAPSVLARLVEEHAEEGDEPGRARLRHDLRRVRALVEGWRWLEECVGAEDDPQIPLGVAAAVLELGRLSDTIGERVPGGLTLWPEGPTASYTDPDHRKSRPGLTEEAHIDESARDAGARVPRPRPTGKKPSAPKMAMDGLPTIAAVISGSYVFPDRAGALEMMDVLARNFVLSSLHDRGDDPAQMVLYIRGYGLTPKRVEEGFLGYPARITPTPLGDGRWTLTARPYEEDLPLSRMPERRRSEHPHPNWGHPILRRVLLNERTDPPGKPYPTWEAAAKELRTLHARYPRTSIPNPGVLYLMVFGRRNEERRPGVQRIVLHIQKDGHGGFVIRRHDNEGRGENT